MCNFIKFFPILICFSLTTLLGCNTSKKQTPNTEQQEPVIIEQEKEEQESIKQPQITEQDQEYLRSISNMENPESITMDTFTQDKKDILELIDQLEIIIKSNNYQKWLNFVDPVSIHYWKNPKNLKEVESRLPVKGIKIKTMQDYFKYIFVPARTDRNVDEIRYISNTLVKAVQVNEDTDIVYYTFEKINDKWMLKLDIL